MPRYEVVIASKVLNKSGYKDLLRKFCKVVWTEGGVVRGLSTLGTRQLPHGQQAKTESGDEKVWKGTLFTMDAVMKEETVSKLSDLAAVESDAIFSKIAPNPATFPLWCGHRERQNEKYAFYTNNIRNFDTENENRGHDNSKESSQS